MVFPKKRAGGAGGAGGETLCGGPKYTILALKTSKNRVAARTPIIIATFPRRSSKSNKFPNSYNNCSKTVIFVIFVRVGIERNPPKSRKSTKMDGSGPLWSRTSIRIAQKRIRKPWFWSESVQNVKITVFGKVLRYSVNFVTFS